MEHVVGERGLYHLNSLCSAYEVLYIAKVLKKLVEA